MNPASYFSPPWHFVAFAEMRPDLTNETDEKEGRSGVTAAFRYKRYQ